MQAGWIPAAKGWLVMVAFVWLALASATASVAPPRTPEVQRELRGGRAILHPKILLITFDPIIRSEGGKRLHEVCGWHDPEELVRGYIDDLADVSGRAIQYRVAAREVVDGFPVKKDGYH